MTCEENDFCRVDTKNIAFPRAILSLHVYGFLIFALKKVKRESFWPVKIGLLTLCVRVCVSPLFFCPHSTQSSVSSLKKKKKSQYKIKHKTDASYSYKLISIHQQGNQQKYDTVFYIHWWGGLLALTFILHHIKTWLLPSALQDLTRINICHW